MRIHFSLFLITILLFSVGCGRTSVNDVLAECKELKSKNDPDAWRKIAAKLGPIYNDKRLKGNEAPSVHIRPRSRHSS